MQDRATESSPPAAATASVESCLLRIVWILVGNGALYLALGMIAADSAPLPSYLDAIAAAAVVVVLGARYLDITRHGGLTVYGDPAGLWHWRRHAAVLLGVTVPAWLLAHAIA